jgi:hypothetical protein
MYSTFDNKMLGEGDKINFDLFFPDSIVEKNDGIDEIFKSQTAGA